VATYYVAKNGNDGWAGSEGQPWLTINHAEDVAVAGDTVYVKAGTYADGVIYFNGTGSSGNEIVFSAFEDDTVVIANRFVINGDYYILNDFEVVTTGGTLSWPNKSVSVYGDYNTINNLYMHDSTAGDKGIMIGKPSILDAHYNTFNNIHILRDSGMFVAGGGSSYNSFVGGLVEFTNGMFSVCGGNHNGFDGLDMHDSGQTEGGSDSSDGIVFSGQVNYVKNCRLWHMFRWVGSQHTDCIQWWNADATGFIIENNVFGSNERGGIFNELDHCNIQYTGQADDVMIKNNIFINGTTPYVFNTSTEQTIHADNWEITGNVFRQNNGIRDNGNAHYWTIKNNVFYQNGTNFTNGAGYDVDHNVYVNKNKSIWDGPGSLEVSDAGFIDDSYDVDYGRGANFHLVPGAPCIDSGSSDSECTTLDGEGNARYDDPLVTNTGTGTYTYWDIGVYEYQGVGGGTVYYQSISGGITSAGGIPVTVPGKLLAGILSLGGNVVGEELPAGVKYRNDYGTLPLAGGLVKAVKRVLAGALAPSATVVGQRGILYQSVSGGLVLGGVVTVDVSRAEDILTERDAPPAISRRDDYRSSDVYEQQNAYSDYKVVIVDNVSGLELAELGFFSGLTFTYGLNQMGDFSFVLPLRDFNATPEIIQPLTRSVRIYRNGNVIFSGDIYTVAVANMAGAPTITVAGNGHLRRLEFRNTHQVSYGNRYSWYLLYDQLRKLNAVHDSGIKMTSDTVENTYQRTMDVAADKTFTELLEEVAAADQAVYYVGSNGYLWYWTEAYSQTREDLVFEYGANIETPELEIDGTQMGNFVHVYGGEPEGSENPVIVTGRNEDSINKWGMYEKTESLTDHIETDYLNAQRDRLLADYREPVENYKFMLIPSRAPEFNAFKLGDRCMLKINRGYFKVNRLARVMGYEFTVEAAGLEKINVLTTVPSTIGRSTRDTIRRLAKLERKGE
jgi:hypothetical protein